MVAGRKLTPPSGRSPYARSIAYATLTALATEDPDPATRAGVLKPVLTRCCARTPSPRQGRRDRAAAAARRVGEGQAWTWTLPAAPVAEGPAGLRSPLGGTPAAPRAARRTRSAERRSRRRRSSPPAGSGAGQPRAVRACGDASGSAPASIEFPGKARGSAAVPPPVGADSPRATPRGGAGEDSGAFDTVPGGRHRGRWIAAVLVMLALLVGAGIFDRRLRRRRAPPQTRRRACGPPACRPERDTQRGEPDTEPVAAGPWAPSGGS